MAKDIPAVKIKTGAGQIEVDLDHKELPDVIVDNAFSSGGYPYPQRMKRKAYERQLAALQLELVKIQAWAQETGQRIVILFEGRDAAGKGGTISRFRQFINPRHARIVALSKPTETERGQWYFQRYTAHLPTTGEIVLFDRSWYNRGGVEPVMGFCTEAQHKRFLEEAPKYEAMLVNDGIHLFKIWLNIGQEMQIRRFHERHQNPMKSWKLSPMDIKALNLWDNYTQARNQMLEATHTDHAPWTIVRSNDKRRARIGAIRHVLNRLEYPGKDKRAIGKADENIVGLGPGFLNAAGG